MQEGECLVAAFMIECDYTKISASAINPLMTVVFGNLTGVFQGFFLGQYTRGYFNHELSHYTLYFVYIGIAEFVVTYVATVAFIYTGEHLTRKIRERYLAAILRQNIGTKSISYLAGNAFFVSAVSS